MNPLEQAASALGLNEGAKKAALTDYLRTGGQNLDPATTAWCAAFVNATLQKSGQTGTNSLMARDFMQWGSPADQPQRGDIAVFSRGDPNGSQGHVGFFDSIGPDGRINVLGGNQGDAVSIASYDPARLLGYRRGQNALATHQQPMPQQQGAQPQNAFAKFAPVQLDARAFQRPQNALALRSFT